ncbi:hypothetical protein COBT_002634 [Conglomerata obtusa]
MPKNWYNKTGSTKYRFKKSTNFINDQNEDETSKLIKSLPNEQETISLAANIEPYRIDDIAYATKLHALITMFLPNLFDLSIEDIHKPISENYTEILRLRDMVMYLGKLLTYKNELYKLKNEMDAIKERIEQKKGVEVDNLLLMNNLIIMRDNTDSEFLYYLNLFKQLLFLQKNIRPKDNGYSNFN